MDQLSDEFRFRIVTDDRDLGDGRPYPNIDEGQWQSVGRARVLYLPRSGRGLRSVARLMRQVPGEILYLNSFFHPWFTTLPLLARRLGLAPPMPIILAPRGEFSPGALSLKPMKKRLFLRAAGIIALHQNLTWQASTPFEAEDIQRLFGTNSRIFIARNVPSAPSFQPSCQYRPSPILRVVFLSRISPKKNLLYALHVLKKISAPLVFSIYGPIEDRSYWEECEKVIASMPPHVKVEYRGAIEPGSVIEELAGHDIFFLPTRGENYGHVIAEALCAGLPLLLSDQTPWRELVRHGVGSDLPLDDPSAFVRYIEEVAKLDGLSREALLRNVREYSSHQIDVDEAACANREMFMSALEQYGD